MSSNSHVSTVCRRASTVPDSTERQKGDGIRNRSVRMRSVEAEPETDMVQGRTGDQGYETLRGDERRHEAHVDDSRVRSARRR